MSFKAVTWAIEQEIFPSSHKFVLIALANFASDKGKSFPGIESVCAITCLKKDAVRNALETLVSSGVIVDTGKRTGETCQVKVYQLPKEACGTFLNKFERDDNSAPLKSRERDGKESVKSRERDGLINSPNTNNREPGTLNQWGNGCGVEEYLNFQSRICVLMGRPANTILRGEEERLLADMIRERPEFESEFLLVSNFKEVCRRDGRRFAESLQSLLERWQVMVDRANNYTPAKLTDVQIKQLQDAIDTHVANQNSVYHKPNCSDQDKSNLRDLRKRLKEIQSA